MFVEFRHLFQDFKLSDVPQLLSIAIDANNDVLLCLGFKTRFDIINIETKELKLLRKIENAKVCPRQLHQYYIQLTAATVFLICICIPFHLSFHS